MKLTGTGWLWGVILAVCSSVWAGPAAELKPARRRPPGSASLAAGNPSGAALAPNPADLTTEELARRTRPSLVVLSTRGRDGVGEGVGTGFVIDSSGLIATSLHVVGEARPVVARLADGKEVEVIAMHAFDRHTDLAILQVAATNLPALQLADSATLAIGAGVVAMGNPMGLENSVVAGVLSGRRMLEEVEMLQIAIPIEPGNSGGPLLDRAGRVHGIVNAKSLLTRNLGFATPVNLLKPLLEHPSPVPFARWIRTGALDPAQWSPYLGAHWRQRSGRIAVEGRGTGFGGRAFILHREQAPALPYELTVIVRLRDESGAAGLIFGGTEDGLHYGFYPTGGQLRLTAFEGPEILSWRILGTLPSPAYRPNEWNVLRVRHETNRIRCWVNGAVVFELEDSGLTGRQVGLAKFRDTSAEFRDFRYGRTLESPMELDPGLVMALGGVELPASRIGSGEMVALRTNLAGARLFLSGRARQLELEAARLRDLSLRLHREQVRDELVAELAQAEDAVDLPRAALLVARMEQADLDIDSYRRQLDALAAELRGRFTEAMPAGQRLELLRKFVFEENGFHGSRHDYYNRANSFLSDVLDDREGLPITLSVVFMALAERAGITHVVGVPLPGHFLVKHAPPGAEERLIDVFDGGRFLTHAEADELGSTFAGVPVRSELMRPASRREMIVRLVTNLQAFTEREEGAGASLRYADLLVAIAGEARAEAAQRLDRARLHAQSGNLTFAKDDLRWILGAAPAGIDVERIGEMIRRLGSDPR